MEENHRGPRSTPGGSVSDSATLEIPGLAALRDAEGQVAIGWLASSVLYVRFSGVLSAELGARYTGYLHAAVLGVTSLQLFADSRDLASYDLLTRSAFVRVVLANRKKFTALVMLGWPGGVTAATRALVATLGQPSEIVTDIRQFETKLFAAAPSARSKLSHTR
ncbi:MAG: hypothetical protein ACOY0T_26405 [Myxococcota bacterium]